MLCRKDNIYGRCAYFSSARNGYKGLCFKSQLLAAGEEKRELMRRLDVIRNDLTHIYKDMKINRAKETYLDLARREIDLCESEKYFSDQYKEADKKEQILFTEFSTAINDSYEKEKLHTNFIKVISIIGTVASSFIALVYSIFMHSQHQKILYAQRSLDDNVVNSIKSLENKVSELLTEWKNNNVSMSVKDQRRNVVESWGSFFHRHTRWLYRWAVKSS
ncbi:uncharacterized protein LOC142238797 isoform X2 [Haematobia irritans]|uniref:uncharacterized protein LOC142238797 isoform X2 n=1 Tax=Haematobia irritans TaxID=7368 RepID=UPI003F50B3B5